eukprot:2468992-Prymnesium_polylepis.1
MGVDLTRSRRSDTERGGRETNGASEMAHDAWCRPRCRGTDRCAILMGGWMLTPTAQPVSVLCARKTVTCIALTALLACLPLLHVHVHVGLGIACGTRRSS